MKQILPLILLITVVSAINSFSQKSFTPPVIVCPADFTHTDFHIPPPSNFLKSFSNARVNATAKTAQIVVNYHGFDDEQEAKDAFQFAVDIWSTLIKSDVTIYIDATYKPLASGVLGSAGTSGLYKGFDGAPNDSTWYNVALAEKMAGHDLNEPGEADINASFSSSFDWYLGTDGNTTSGKHDFVTVVLHEIGHGLGFFALNSYDETADTGRRSPGVFDHYIEDGEGVKIYDVSNNSSELGDFFTSDNLFLNAPLAVTSNGGTIPKIYAPTSYNSGSSISHWDENTYNGTANALLTPQIGSGESIHDPGPNMMSLFADMGWVHTYLKHQPDLIVDNLTDNILITVEVTSDTTLSVEQPVLHYSFDDFATQTNQNMNDDGGGVYSFTIPNPGSTSVLQYYISGVSDVLGRSYTSPGISSARHKTIIQDLAAVTVPYSLANGGDFENPSEFIQVAFKGNTNIWEQGVPTNVLKTPSSGTQVWKTDLDANLKEPDADFSTALITPKFNLSDTIADYNLKFDLSMDVETAAAGLSVVYSVDGGTTWKSLGEPNDGRGVNWMNRSDEYLLFESGNAWVQDNTEDAPETVSYNLSEMIGNGESEVYFGLIASVTNAYNDTIYNFDGILIDDFEITKTDPRAFFSVTSSSVNLPGDTIQFEYISKGAETFTWDFGDGESSNKKNPKHAYQAGGIYDVSLTITYPGGGNHTHTKDSLINVVALKGSTYTLANGGDMESNFSDFLVENISGTPLERGKSTIAGKSGTASGNIAWVSGIDEEKYQDRSVAYLYTPIFDFSLLGDYELSFKANYQFEDGWDGFILEYSLDFGENWKQLNPVVEDGWYDKIGEDNPDQGWPAIPLFTGSTNGNFDTKSVKLNEFGGNDRVAFRFYFKTDYASVDVGMALDDVTLTGPQLGAATADFTYEGDTGCNNQVVIFTSTSTGSISSMNWDFGANATPATASGIGPFEVTYTGNGSSTVTLTLESPENGTQIETKAGIISTAPAHTPSYISEAVAGNDAQLTLTATDGDVFQWFLNSDSIMGANQKTYLAEKSGNYSVAVNVGGCIGISSGSSIITALNNDLQSQGVYIYPNPVSDNLFIGVENEYRGVVDLKIMNTVGKEFYRSVSSKEDLIFSKEIDVNNFSEGIYIVDIKFADKRMVYKIIIE